MEWRLFDAGQARLEFNGQNIARVNLESAGIVGRLYPVRDTYMSVVDSALCTSTVSMQAEEGARRRETLVTFDKPGKKIHYVERDLVKKNTVLDKTLASPGCVHDVIGGLMRVRSTRMEPGQTMTLPMSDGKRLVNAKIEAEERETIKTPAGTFQTVRYQAHLFDGALFERKGSLFFWLTDDARRLPVQFQARLRFYIGTITVLLTDPKEPATNAARRNSLLLLPLFALALAGQNATAPLMNGRDSLALAGRTLQLMESLSFSVPDLGRAATPLQEAGKQAELNLRLASGQVHTAHTYAFLRSARGFLSLFESMARPFPYSAEATRQHVELQDAVQRLEVHFRALLDQRELALRPPDRDNLRRYADANLKLPPAGKQRVVFYGDSITDGWRIAEYFPGQDYVNRGISGQVTGEMLGRLKADVLDLKPGRHANPGRHQRHRARHGSHHHRKQPHDDRRSLRAAQNQTHLFLCAARQRLSQGQEPRLRDDQAPSPGPDPLAQPVAEKLLPEPGLHVFELLRRARRRRRLFEAGNRRRRIASERRGLSPDGSPGGRRHPKDAGHCPARHTQALRILNASRPA